MTDNQQGNMQHATTPNANGLLQEQVAAHQLAYDPVAKRIAASIFKMMQYEAPEYVAVLPNAFKHLDLKTYDRTAQQLAAFGFSKSIDAESLSFKRSFGKRVMLRFALMDDGNTVAAIYQVPPNEKPRFAWLKKLLGTLPKMLTTVEFETRFVNGHEVLTNNLTGRNVFSAPPEIHSTHFAPDAALDDIWRIHQQCIVQFMQKYPGCEVRSIDNLDDIEQAALHTNQLKASHRRKFGGATRDELMALTKEKFPFVEAGIRSELARLMATQGDTAANASTTPSGTAETPVPAWASFFSTADYALFTALVVTDFARRGKVANINDGVVSTASNDANSSDQHGLQNLAQRCHQERQSAAWPALIASHFTATENARQSATPTIDAASEFAKIANALTIRLYPADYYSSVPAASAAISRSDLDGTISALVIDLPEAVLPVTRDMSRAWGKTDAELFAHALRWLKRDKNIESGALELGQGITVRLVASDGFYAASQALNLEQHQGMIGSHGALVCVPHRHSLVAYPIENRAVATAVERLIPAVINMHHEGPGAISPHLYLYRNKKFTRLPVHTASQSMVSPAFAAFVDSLPAV
ncbi:hypothetical protein [Undibacterium sp. TJN19]|uniref:hypothetical protein n=1 Tax=Undibacterium sp. TJN19 TaxID=3413055 RepID=UPI003BF0A452